MSWLSSAINKVKKWQPGKTQWKDVAGAAKNIAPIVLGATGVGLPWAAAAGAGLNVASKGKKANIGDFLSGGARGAAGGAAGAGLAAGKAALSGGEGVVGAIESGASAAREYARIPGLGDKGSQVVREVAASGGGAGGDALVEAGGSGLVPVDNGFFGGLSSMEKAFLLSRLIGTGASVYGAHQQGQMEDRDYKRYWGDRSAAGKAFAPYLQKYLEG